MQNTANGTESPTVATQDLIPYRETHQTADSIEIEVMETGSSIQNLGPVMETESITKTTEDSNLMPERQQNADSTEMEDSDLQPEFSSSNDDNEVDPDFDFDKELKMKRQTPEPPTDYTPSIDDPEYFPSSDEMDDR